MSDVCADGHLVCPACAAYGAEQERRRTNKIIESMYDCGFDAEDTEERRENISISNRWFTEMSELEIDQAAYEDGYNNGKKDGAEQERRRIMDEMFFIIEQDSYDVRANLLLELSKEQKEGGRGDD